MTLEELNKLSKVNSDIRERLTGEMLLEDGVLHAIAAIRLLTRVVDKLIDELKGQIA